MFRRGDPTAGSGPRLWADVAHHRWAVSWQAGRVTTVRMGGASGPPTGGSEVIHWVLSEPWSSWRFWGGFFWAVCGCRRGSGQKDCWRTWTWSSWWSGTPGRWWPSGAGTERLDRKKKTDLQNHPSQQEMTTVCPQQQNPWSLQRSWPLKVGIQTGTSRDLTDPNRTRRKGISPQIPVWISDKFE